jgi:dTMP kinase
MTGRFITFEGGEGSGKSTQARLLAAHLRSRGIAVVETREPGGSPFAEALRGFILDPATPAHAPLSEALLFTAARADHLDTTIRPALARGDWVICDRFTDSTRVYQGAAGGLADATLATLESLVVGATRPDLTVLLDLDAKTGLARARVRAGGAAPDGYEPGRIVVVDAARPPDLIADDVRDLVATRFGSA